MPAQPTFTASIRPDPGVGSHGSEHSFRSTPCSDALESNERLGPQTGADSITPNEPPNASSCVTRSFAALSSSRY